VIQPGIMISADTLFRRTAQLPATDIVPPKRVIARRTDECIRAGVLFGAVDSIEGSSAVLRTCLEWGMAAPTVIAYNTSAGHDGRGCTRQQRPAVSGGTGGRSAFLRGERQSLRPSVSET